VNPHFLQLVGQWQMPFLRLPVSVYEISLLLKKTFIRQFHNFKLFVFKAGKSNLPAFFCLKLG
jgi:hypothetical protein